MRFTVRGKKGQEEVQVTWEDGNLSGHRGLTAGIRAGATEPFFVPGHGTLDPDLSNPLRALQFIGYELGAEQYEVTAVEGDIPEPEELPEGHIP
jgi:hypothetical protein